MDEGVLAREFEERGDVTEGEAGAGESLPLSVVSPSVDLTRRLTTGWDSPGEWREMCGEWRVTCAASCVMCDV